jgi:hypothetical protein
MFILVPYKRIFYSWQAFYSPNRIILARAYRRGAPRLISSNFLPVVESQT